MYMGGMHVTPLPMKQPSRMLDPPGTMRTPSPRVRRAAPGKSTCRTSGWRTGSIDISTIEPMRKPSRMPFLTQAFTRQPVFEEASGSAERIAPAFRASLNRSKRPKVSFSVRRRFFVE